MTKLKITIKKLVLLVFVISIFGNASVSNAQDKNEVLLVSDVKWTPLNPARGKLGPQAGNLWGDRTGVGPSGFLVKFVDGFSSPPHIHNIMYRGVVISGLVHNDDPSANKAWMSSGSYWTQAAGEIHITAAKGSQNIAYIEIEQSPYLVLPTSKAFDEGDKSVNIEASNIVWLDATNTQWIKQAENTSSKSAAKIAFLWGEPQGKELNGTFVKLPAGSSGKILVDQPIMRGVLIQGKVNHGIEAKGDQNTLMPGSYFSSQGKSIHYLAVDESEGCIIYLRSKGSYELVMD
ncbi:MAG: DUF4437 domain-containing protein [Pseudomonadota bacterium]